jgi:hypothetical protein
MHVCLVSCIFYLVFSCIFYLSACFTYYAGTHSDGHWISALGLIASFWTTYIQRRKIGFTDIKNWIMKQHIFGISQLVLITSSCLEVLLKYHHSKEVHLYLFGFSVGFKWGCDKNATSSLYVVNFCGLLVVLAVGCRSRIVFLASILYTNLDVACGVRIDRWPLIQVGIQLS